MAYVLFRGNKRVCLRLEDVREIVTAGNKLLEASHGLDHVSRQIQEIVSSTQEAAQRANLVTILKETFMCLICRAITEEPVFTSCCRSVVGCKVCLNQWMENSRQCPKCRSEDFVITEVAGLSSLLEVTKSFV